MYKRLCIGRCIILKNISNEVKSNLGAQFLVEINDKGWFDQFSDQHFLIRALNNDMDYFNRHRSLINNSSYYSEKNNPINFVVNFSLHFKLFCSHFKENNLLLHSCLQGRIIMMKNNFLEL